MSWSARSKKGDDGRGEKSLLRNSGGVGQARRRARRSDDAVKTVKW